MRVNPVLSHDYNSESWAPAERIECAGFNNKRMSPDYSARDKRVWLRQCLHRDCSAERCTSFKVCPRCNKPEEFCSCEEDSLSNGTVVANGSLAEPGVGSAWLERLDSMDVFRSSDLASTERTGGSTDA